MTENINEYSLTRFAATVAELAGIEKPALADEPVEEACCELKNLAGGSFERVLIYNPDAIAMWLCEKYREDFAAVRRHAPLTIPFASVLPSKTPVCFGTMYTGAMPQVHGIEKYEKLVIKIDSLFDSLVRAGKKTAIVAVENSSMSKIFAGRNIDYFFCIYDSAVIKKAIELIEKGEYDFICVYTQGYDDSMHLTGVESRPALRAMRKQIKYFDKLAKSVKKYWPQKNSLITFSPDHGVHNQSPHRGTHGSDLPEDINIYHFFGAVPGAEQQ